MQRETYVESRAPFSGLKLLMPFISPIVPIEIKSSWSTFELLYFLQTCATNLKFLSISRLRASSSPVLNFSRHIRSSSELNGSGKSCTPEMYPTVKTAVCKNCKKPFMQSEENIKAPPFFIIKLYVEKK